MGLSKYTLNNLVLTKMDNFRILNTKIDNMFSFGGQFFQKKKRKVLKVEDIL